MKRNNVAVERVEKTIAEFRAEPGKARRTQRVEGVWNLIEGKPQFSATVVFDGKSAVLEADQPSFLGGGGAQPGPILYCLFGLAACYAGTFATTAAMMGVELTSLKVVAENDVNFSSVMGLAETPPIEKVRLTVQVSSPAPQAKLKEVETLASQRCPAVYCLTHPIPLETSLELKSA